jgi:hypothetical protein
LTLVAAFGTFDSNCLYWLRQSRNGSFDALWSCLDRLIWYVIFILQCSVIHAEYLPSQVHCSTQGTASLFT